MNLRIRIHTWRGRRTAVCLNGLFFVRPIGVLRSKIAPVRQRRWLTPRQLRIITSRVLR